jgi:plasmid replication initiation protein
VTKEWCKVTIDISKVNEHWIYQSNKLIEASYTLTVLEQKLIRLLASMIKKDDEDFTEYEFKTKELIKLLNTSDSRFYRDIDTITDLLMQRVIKIKDINTGYFEKYHWVDIAKYKNGTLKLKINKELKPFYLSLDWYTKYQLKNIMQFKSTYSFRLYELLKQYENIGYRLLIIDKLRDLLDINKDQYAKYANLKQKVINIAVNEINKNTDLNIEFEELKDGRKVISIRFIIKSNGNNNTKNQINIAEVEEIELKESLIEQTQMIFNRHKITKFEAKKILIAANNDIEIVKQKYEIICHANNIKNIVGSTIQAIKENWQDKKQENTNTFNSFKQRQYNFKELEKQLLGWK